jgi:hypothetical protein
MKWLMQVLFAALFIWMIGGCDLAEWAEQYMPPPCPTCECTLEECIDAFGDLFD